MREILRTLEVQRLDVHDVAVFAETQTDRHVAVESFGDRVGDAVGAVTHSLFL